MNICKKGLARIIVQNIVDKLNALESLGNIKWNISEEDKQANYRSWAKMTLKNILEADEPDVIEHVFMGQFDGSSKPNPGEMKIGGYIKSLADMDNTISTFSLDKGYGTNNRAEYLALIELLKMSITKGIKRINIYGDSKIVIMQVNGKWKANKDMAPLRDQAVYLLDQFDHWSLSHVPRELNSEADSLTR